MEAAADIGHGHPLLYDQHPGDHVVAAQDLSGDEVADLVEGAETRRCQILRETPRTQGFGRRLYIVEVLRRSHDVRRLLVLVVLHPALSEEFPARGRRRTVVSSSAGPPPAGGGGTCCHSLVWNELEHHVVEQGELLRDLQGRVALEGFGLRRRHLGRWKTGSEAIRMVAAKTFAAKQVVEVDKKWIYRVICCGLM